MSVNPVKRKLAAILAADAVGYSRMMAADEEGTMKILSAHRSVIDGIIQFHEGRIISTAGDSVLAEFASPTQAVRCAVEIQDALKTRNDALPEERRMHFRIGVNLGDVMVKGDDLLGDGVNVAARLEGIAEPGNIYVSSSVYDQIAGKLDLAFVDLGEQELKNIDRPIRTYRVERGEGRRAKGPARKAGRGAGAWVGAAAVVVAVGAAAWYAAQHSQGRKDEEAKARASAETELAKARSEAEEARKAAAAATSSAEAAKRALEEQRIAETRARAQAELASARAEAEATRRKAQAELASAEEARRAAEAASRARAAGQSPAAASIATAAKSPPTPASATAPSTRKWAAIFACGSIGTSPPASFDAVATSAGDSFALHTGKRGQPGWLQMTGTRNTDGTLKLTGSGIGRTTGEPYPAMMEGKFGLERYHGRGTFGERDCSLMILTEADAARRAAEFPGPWTAHFACAAQESLPPSTYYAPATVNGQEFELARGKPGELGSWRMTGRREADGRMRLAGKGVSSMKEFYGRPYTLAFDGKFSGERYTGRGKTGARDCTLTIARR
jgi:class 3 adenylate cyclase